MANDTATLALNGEISLRLFVEGMRHFLGLIDALTSEVSDRRVVEWLVDALADGSAITTVRGEPLSQRGEESVGRVVRAYGEVGRALEEGRPIPYSDRVVREAESLVNLLNGQLTSLRFETSELEATVVSPSVERRVKTAYLRAFGAVEGRIQTVTNRRGLRFVLYDTLYDHPVSCYLDEGQEALMRDAWGHHAFVEGWISRDAVTGQPVAIRHITSVVLVPEPRAGGFEAARGILHPSAETIPAEEAIRRVRDEW